MKKAVIQKDGLGCSLACLAFITGKSYEEIADKLDREKAKSRGFYCRELVAYLKNLGYQVEYHYLNKKWLKKIYQDNTIVFVRRGKKYPFGHYFVRYKNLWMDSWINFLKDKDLRKVRAGFRKRLPEKPIYGIFVKASPN